MLDAGPKSGPTVKMVAAAIARRAKENGYDLDVWSEWEIAVDLCDCYSYFESFDVVDVYEVICLMRNGSTVLEGKP